MVKNSRKTQRSSSFRVLNQPLLIEVKENAEHCPIELVHKHKRLKVISIDDIWEIMDEWWKRNPIERCYYRVVTREGIILTIFRDMVSSNWYIQNV